MIFEEENWWRNNLSWSRCGTCDGRGSRGGCGTFTTGAQSGRGGMTTRLTRRDCDELRRRGTDRERGESNGAGKEVFAGERMGQCFAPATRMRQAALACIRGGSARASSGG